MKNIRFEETHEIVQIEDQNMAQERVNIYIHFRETKKFHESSIA